MAVANRKDVRSGGRHISYEIPERWEEYPSLGQRICGFPIVCFKAPIRYDVLAGRGVQISSQFTPESLIEGVREQGMKLGLVIDLTATNRFYDPAFFMDGHGIQFHKVPCEAGALPSESSVVNFFRVVDKYMRDDRFAGENCVVGIHCYDGVNITGYLVCRYITQRCMKPATEAIDLFQDARGYKIERADFVDNLKKHEEDSPPLLLECFLERGLNGLLRRRGLLQRGRKWRTLDGLNREQSRAQAKGRPWSDIWTRPEQRYYNHNIAYEIIDDDGSHMRARWKAREDKEGGGSIWTAGKNFNFSRGPEAAGSSNPTTPAVNESLKLPFVDTGGSAGPGGVKVEAACGETQQGALRPNDGRTEGATKSPEKPSVVAAQPASGFNPFQPNGNTAHGGTQVTQPWGDASRPSGSGYSGFQPWAFGMPGNLETFGGGFMGNAFASNVVPAGNRGFHFGPPNQQPKIDWASDEPLFDGRFSAGSTGFNNDQFPPSALPSGNFESTGFSSLPSHAQRSSAAAAAEPMVSSHPGGTSGPATPVQGNVTSYGCPFGSFVTGSQRERGGREGRNGGRRGRGRRGGRW